MLAIRRREKWRKRDDSWFLRIGSLVRLAACPTPLRTPYDGWTFETSPFVLHTQVHVLHLLPLGAGPSSVNH